MTDGLGNHGTVGRYSRGCRCSDCRESANEAKRRQRARRRLGEVSTFIREEWRDQAACKGKPTQWWFAFASSPEHAVAQEICSGCPVLVDCTFAGEGEYGRWGRHVHLDRRDERRGLEREVARFEREPDGYYECAEKKCDDCPFRTRTLCREWSCGKQAPPCTG